MRSHIPELKSSSITWRRSRLKDLSDMGLITLCDARDKHKNGVRFECMHIWPSLMMSFRPVGKDNIWDSDVDGKEDREGNTRGRSYVFNIV